MSSFNIFPPWIWDEVIQQKFDILANSRATLVNVQLG